MRIGPKMRLAADLVARDEGRCMYHYAKQLHRACDTGRNNAYGYNPIHRALRAKLIRMVDGRLFAPIGEA